MTWQQQRFRHPERRNEELRKVLAEVGTQRQIATMVHLTQAGVCQWISSGWIPDKRVVSLLALVEDEELRTKIAHYSRTNVLKRHLAERAKAKAALLAAKVS